MLRVLRNVTNDDADCRAAADNDEMHSDRTGLLFISGCLSVCGIGEAVDRARSA